MRKKPRKRLSDACRRYGIEGWENIDKEEIAKAIGEGRWREYGEAAVYEYCEEDVQQVVRACCALSCVGYGTLCAPSTRKRSCVGRTTAPKPSPSSRREGMPIDMPLWNLVQENQAAVIAALIRQFDPSQGSEYPIYSPEGEWSYERFARWLVAAGITEWPRLAVRRARDRERRLPHDVPGASGDRRAARAYATLSASLYGAGFRSAPTAATARACFRSAPRPAAMRKPRACSMHTPACARSWVPTRQDRALSRLANAGSRHCGGAQRG